MVASGGGGGGGGGGGVGWWCMCPLGPALTVPSFITVVLTQYEKKTIENC